MKTKLPLLALLLATCNLQLATLRAGPGPALSFNGANNYVSATIPALASNYTICAWVYLRNGGDFSTTRLGVLTGTACNDSVEMLVRSDTSSATDPQYLELGRCGGFSGARSAYPVPLNQWVHLAVSVSSNRSVHYCLNGTNAGYVSIDNGYNMTLGPAIHLGDNAVRKFNGILDEVQIWNRVLSEAEIQANMSRFLAGSESGLVAYWPFAETNTGTWTYNHAVSTGAASDGTMVNSPAFVLSGAQFVPDAATSAATSVGATSATLNGAVNPCNLATRVWYEWGTNTSYGNRTATNTLSAANAISNPSLNLTGLTPNRTYHFRIVAASSAGTINGADQSFTTLLLAPAVSTLAATGVNSGGGTLNATINANGLPTAAWFEWGTSVSYGQVTAVTNLAATGNTLNLSSLLTGLPLGQLCHYRVVATNSVGAAIGADQSFQTILLKTNLACGLPAASSNTLTEVMLGSFDSYAWGDYDNDGHLDVLFRSGGTTAIYRSLGNGTFANINAGLPGLYYGAASWGDYDNDGMLDVLLAGSLSSSLTGSVTLIYHNNGNGTFTEVNGALPGMLLNTASWMDYDNDGRLDVLITGITTNATSCSFLLRNLGNGAFADLTTDVPGVLGSVSCGDYDNDGYPDLAMAGYTELPLSNCVARIYRNNHDGTFSNINAGLPSASLSGLGVASRSVAWGDYNNDGQLDLLYLGHAAGNASTNILRIYRNNGNGAFSETDPGLPGGMGAAAWGDYDNDGKLDILVSGALNYTLSNACARIYRNSGITFTPVNQDVPGPIFGSATWVDYDNDGRLDFLVSGVMGMSGFGNFVPGTQLYQNCTAVTNTPPTAPFGAQAVPSNGKMILSWNAATDGQTPAASLTYNIRIGTTPGGCDVVSASASAATGRRRLPGMGNRQFGTNCAVAMQPGTTNYWSVQAVDSIGAGSAFTTEGIVYMPTAPAATTLAATSISSGQATLQGTVNPGGQATLAWFEWGTTLAYGNFTPMTSAGSGRNAVAVNATLTGLAAGTTYHYRVVGYNNFGVTQGADLSFTTPAGACTITGAGFAGAGQFQIHFSGTSGLTYTALTSTNVALPINQWTPLGTASEIGSGQFQFTDTSATNVQRFYRLRTP